MSVELVSVLPPYEYVCKQSVVAKSAGKFKLFKIYDIKLAKKEGMKLLKRLREFNLSLQERDRGREDVRQLVQRYIDRLRDEEGTHFGDNVNPAPIQKFEEMVEKFLRTDPAAFSLATTKTEDCFVALVRKQLSKENGEIVDMTIYFLEEGVKANNAGGAGPVGEEEGAVGGAVGGAAEEQRNGPTLVLPKDWRNSFARSLENNIHLCHGHIRPALEALHTGQNSYTDVNGKICKFNSSAGDRQLVQGRKIFQSKLSHKLHDMNPQCASRLCKVHLNGEGSDCYLVYVDQNYKKMGRVFLLVGVFTHSEVGIKTGARKKEHGTQRGGSRNIPDATLDMEAAERYLQ